ncbi:hypothetical protein M0804_013407 [Polistes exclamans]|nr:hypothetical protein M0804_013407 [Polistes exclamans]
MSNELLLNEYNLTTIYQHRAFRMMNIYISEDEEKFYKWLNKFEFVANVIGVPDTKMIEFFEIMVDNKMQNKMKMILFIGNISELPYDEIIDKYLYYFYLSPKTGYQNRFYIRNQYEREPIRNYANRLLKIYNKCDYGNIIDDILCEKFFNGLREDLIRIHFCKSLISSFGEMLAKAIEFEKDNLITYYSDQALLMINSYNQEKEGHFYVWLNKFEYVADKLEVPENKMLELFYNMVDNDVHSSVLKTNSSIDFQNLSYDDTTKFYFYYFLPSSEIDLNENRFLCRNQYERETIEKYAYNLNKIYNKCDNTKFPEERLCKKFSKGLNDNHIKANLTRMSGLSFPETLRIAIKLKKDFVRSIYLIETQSKINIYHPKYAGEFYLWLNKFEYVASILVIPDDVIIEIFNKMVHDDVHTSVKTTYSCTNLSELSYDKLVNLYISIFISSDKVYFHRNRFIARIQYEQENIENYFNNLKRIIDKCKYAENTTDILYKQFISGLRENDIRTHLKENPNLTYDQLVAEANKFEKMNLITYYLDRIILMINCYNQEKEGHFYVWLNRFEYLADLIEVPDNKMIELFNKMVDENVHTFVQKTYSSVDFSKLLYERMIDYYLLYFYSSHEVNVDKKRFTSRKQFMVESIEKYAVCLRKLHDKYYFKTSIIESLRKQFISGMRDENTRTQLNEMSDLSFEQMVVWAIEFNVKETHLQG